MSEKYVFGVYDSQGLWGGCGLGRNEGKVTMLKVIAEAIAEEAKRNGLRVTVWQSETDHQWVVSFWDDPQEFCVKSEDAYYRLAWEGKEDESALLG